MKLECFDIVALKDSLPEHRLLPGQVETIVELLAPDVKDSSMLNNGSQRVFT